MSTKEFCLFSEIEPEAGEFILVTNLEMDQCSMTMHIFYPCEGAYLMAFFPWTHWKREGQCHECGHLLEPEGNCTMCLFPLTL